MTAQLDLFASLGPITLTKPAEASQPSAFARAVLAAREQSPELWPFGFKYRPYGGFCDRITDPPVPSQHDDWPPLFYVHCHIRPGGVAATLNGGYQDRRSA